METIQKRKKLHQYIDSADDDKVNALYLILESTNVNAYSPEDLKMFYARRERHLKGDGKSFSVKESFEKIRKSI